jgi:hypothetical protein
MFDLIGFTVFIILFFILIFDNFKIRRNLKKIKNDFIQEKANNLILLEKLSYEINNKENTSIEKSEGFLNFVTQSRDWAFAYIETVQDGLNDFVNTVDKDIEYIAEYKPPIVNSDMQERLIYAYLELKKLLPEKDVVSEKE